MSAIQIKVDGDQVSLIYEEKNGENIARRLNQLKDALGITWYGMAAVFGLKPTEASVRLFKRWARDPSLASYQEMPDSQWKYLLTLTEGQEVIKRQD
ncbi:hypothetical protein [Vibrio parahaemolyticus]|uniref:hypothetical protein n=1 Tax=Vibrio parahaemolyticus TaxID=670 RepID=UPI001E5C19F0|nr:hypothetical protein [Vibrio parahaemolyticus]